MNTDNKYAIGLEPQNNLYDFENMLNEAFHKGYNTKIGNIIIKVDGISKSIIEEYQKQKNISFPKSITHLDDCTIDGPIQKIEYEEYEEYEITNRDCINLNHDNNSGDNKQKNISEVNCEMQCNKLKEPKVFPEKTVSKELKDIKTI